MSYSTVSASMLALLRAVSGFGATTVTQGDWRVLAGGGQQCIVINFNGVTPVPHSVPNRYAMTWQINVDFYVRFRGEQSFYETDIGVTVQAILTQLLGYPRLNNTAGVTGVSIGAVGSPSRNEAELPNWWVTIIPVIVTDIQTVAILEP